MIHAQSPAQSSNSISCPAGQGRAVFGIVAHVQLERCGRRPDSARLRDDIVCSEIGLRKRDMRQIAAQGQRARRRLVDRAVQSDDAFRKGITVWGSHAVC